MLVSRRTEDGGGAAISARGHYERLRCYVEDPVATDDPEAKALLRQGRERWNSAGAILADAKSAPDYELAEHVAKEGLAHVATAYARLGLPEPS
jgi:hypothetical protein